MSSSPNMGAASHWSECCQLLTLATVSLVSCAVSCPEWELEALVLLFTPLAQELWTGSVRANWLAC